MGLSTKQMFTWIYRGLMVKNRVREYQIYRDFPQLFAWTFDNNYLWSKVIEGLGTI